MHGFCLCVVVQTTEMECASVYDVSPLFCTVDSPPATPRLWERSHRNITGRKSAESVVAALVVAAAAAEETVAVAVMAEVAVVAVVVKVVRTAAVAVAVAKE